MRVVDAHHEDHSLKRRELDIVGLRIDAMNHIVIGEKPFMSLDTVRDHIRHIYEKLHVHSKSQAVARALKHSVV